MIMKKIFGIVSALFLLSTMTVCAQNFKVIVNNANTASSVTTKELSDFFLKRKSKWSSGGGVEVIDLGAKSSTRESFSSSVLGKSTAQVRAFWQQAVFSGANTPPREANNEAEVVEFVKNNPGAIGYVSPGANTSGVKTLTVK